MLPENIASTATTLSELLIAYLHDVPASFDLEQLRTSADAINHRAPFQAGRAVLAALPGGLCLLGPFAVRVSAATLARVSAVWLS